MAEAQLKRLIPANAAEITRLQSRIDATLCRRDESEGQHAEWEAACAEFHDRYDALAFPGGYDKGLVSIQAGEPASIEAALCFLELRPYFFRSGYMHKVLLRKLKYAALSPQQSIRLMDVLERQAQWRACKAGDVAA